VNLNILSSHSHLELVHVPVTGLWAISSFGSTGSLIAIVLEHLTLVCCTPPVLNNSTGSLDSNRETKELDAFVYATLLFSTATFRGSPTWIRFELSPFAISSLQQNFTLDRRKRKPFSDSSAQSLKLTISEILLALCTRPATHLNSSPDLDLKQVSTLHWKPHFRLLGCAIPRADR
jgi:hypothetical protein